MMILPPPAWKGEAKLGSSGGRNKNRAVSSAASLEDSGAGPATGDKRGRTAARKGRATVTKRERNPTCTHEHRKNQFRQNKKETDTRSGRRPPLPPLVFLLLSPAQLPKTHSLRTCVRKSAGSCVREARSTSMHAVRSATVACESFSTGMKTWGKHKSKSHTRVGGERVVRRPEEVPCLRARQYQSNSGFDKNPVVRVGGVLSKE